MIWRLVGGVVVAALAIIGLAAATLLFTAQGARVLSGAAERMLAPALAIEGVSGALAGELCAERVTYLQPGLVVELDSVCVQPNLWLSFDFLKVSLASLQAARVQVQTIETGQDQPAAEAAGDPDAVWLPVTVEVTRLELGELAVNSFALAGLNGSLNLAEDNLVSRSRFTLEDQLITVATSGQWSALRAELGFSGVAVDATLNLRAPRLPFMLEASAGRLDLATWVGRQTLISGLNMSADGDLDNIRVEASAQLDDAELGKAGVRVSGGTDLSQASFDALLTNAQPELADVAVGKLALAGQIGWTPDVRFDVTATASGFAFEPRALLLDGVFELRGSPDEFEVAGRSLVGSSHGVPISGAVGARWDHGLVHIDDALIKTDDGARLEILGTARTDGEFELNATADRFPLAALDPVVGGAVSGRLRVRGPLESLTAQGQLQVAPFGYSDYEVDKLALSFDGRGDAASVTVEAQRADQSAAAVFDYALGADSVVLDIRSLTAEARESAAGPLRVTLVRPVTVTVASGRIAADDVCLSLVPLAVGEQPAELCGDIHYPEGPVRVSLQPFPLPSMAVLGDTLGFRGELRADLDLAEFSPPRGQARLAVNQLVAVDNEQQTLALGDLEATVELSDYQALIDVRTPPAQSFQLGASLQAILAAEPLDSEISGQVKMDLDGIWLVESLLPIGLQFDVGDIRGAVTVDAAVSGTLRDPAIDGAVRLSDAGWHLFALNTDFENVAMQARLVDSDRLALTADGDVGGGKVEISGSLNGLAGEDPELNAEIQVSDSRVVDLPDYSAVLDGQASLTMTRDALNVTGALKMPKALVQINELPETAVSASSDAVLVGEEVEASRQQLRNTNLSLKLGRDVRLQAFGLDTFLEGNLNLVERPGEPPWLTGAITLRDGTFEAYGQELEVQRGRLTFTGPMDNPLVDVVASRVVIHENRDVLITLVIGGTARDLSTEVRSSPQLPPEDALALLITGRTFSQASTEGQVNVSGAALALGLFGATGITGNMAETLGLEEIIIDQDSEGNMEVGAAVRVHRDFYLRYTYSVFSRIGGVLLRYRLSSRVSVQAQTGDTHSIEIHYGVD